MKINILAGLILILLIGGSGYWLYTNDDIIEPTLESRKVVEPADDEIKNNIADEPIELSEDAASNSKPVVQNSEEQNSIVQRVNVTIDGGHETNPVDMGRPVSLIAGALNVPDEVFREAFSHVTPEDQGHLNPDTAQRNKAELLPRLEPYGVTNERLDEVTNYYRYPPQSTQIWPIQDATVVALIQDGKITGFEVEDGGSGYSSIPTFSVDGFGRVSVDVDIEYTANFSTNGSIVSVNLKK